MELKELVQPLAKVYLEDGKLVFEALSEKDVADGIYLSGKHENGYRMGVVVINSAKNLVVTKDAEPVFKKFFQDIPQGRDPVGDISWYYDAYNRPIFSWFGENKRVFDMSQIREWEKSRTTSFRDGEYNLLD